MARNTKFTKKTGILSEAEIVENDVISEDVKEETSNDEVSTDKLETSEGEEVDTSKGQDSFSPSIGDEVSFESNEVKDTKVKIRLNANHRCCIGGERYYFEEDKVYSVNPNIKRILNKSGLLKPLN